MAFYHTTPDQTKLYVGSGRVYIAEVVSDVNNAIWEELGTMSALAVTGKLSTAQPSAVNGQHKKIVTEEGASIAFSMQEIIAENMAKCTGGLTSIEVITATPVTLSGDSAQKIIANTATTGKYFAFSQQSYAGSNGAIVEPTNVAIKQNGSELNLGSDYEIIQDATGKFGFVFKQNGAFDTTLATDVEYTYTPIGKTIVHQGGKVSTTDKMVKIVNEQSDGRKIETVYYLCEFTEGGALNLKTDGSADLIDFNVTLEARNDTSRPVGKQLYEIAFSN